MPSSEYPISRASRVFSYEALIDVLRFNLERKPSAGKNERLLREAYQRSACRQLARRAGRHVMLILSGMLCTFFQDTPRRRVTTRTVRHASLIREDCVTCFPEAR